MTPVNILWPELLQKALNLVYHLTLVLLYVTLFPHSDLFSTPIEVTMATAIVIVKQPLDSSTLRFFRFPINFYTACPFPCILASSHPRLLCDHMAQQTTS